MTVSDSFGDRTVPRPEDYVGRVLHEEVAEIDVDRGFIQNWCEAMEDGNPLYWDDEAADGIAGGLVAPPTMLPTWLMPLRWHPGQEGNRRPLEAHSMLKDAFHLPEGVAIGNEIEFLAPVRLGHRLRAQQSVLSISDERTNRLGTGREWAIEITYRRTGEDVIVGREIFRLFAYQRKE